MLWLTILHRNMLKIYIKLVNVKIFVKVWQIHEFSISCFPFICPKFGADSQILHRIMLKNCIKLVKFEKLCQIVTNTLINFFLFHIYLCNIGADSKIICAVMLLHDCSFKNLWYCTASHYFLLCTPPTEGSEAGRGAFCFLAYSDLYQVTKGWTV